jgi:hypothetical protein
MPHLMTSDPDFSYFDLSRPPAGSNDKPDQLHLAGMDSSFSKLRLQALPSPSLMPPSPFDLGGDSARSIPEKLDNTGHLGRKGGRRRIVEYININGVDEPFYSYIDDDEPPSPSAATLLPPPPNGFLPLYE